MPEHPIGQITGQQPGTTYADRRALRAAGIHRPLQAGIAGSGKTGAESIILNGGYEDDEDFWDYIVYTGQGGNDPATGRQVADQELTRGNLALARSCDDGLPVRVVRGWREPSGYGPPAGFRYDGLYYVESYWQERGKSGFLIWRFRLVRDPATTLSAPAVVRPLKKPKPRQVSLPNRPSSLGAQKVKTLEGYACQVCGLVLRTPAGPYAEIVHLRPLGAPHDGHDAPDNILCVCPNHRVLLDSGAVTLTTNGDVVDGATGQVMGRLRSDAAHSLDEANIEYHAQIHRPRRARPAG